MFVAYINKTAYICITKVNETLTTAKLEKEFQKTNSYGSIGQKKLGKGWKI